MRNHPRQVYAVVLGCALLCYCALGAVLRLLPSYVPGRLHGDALGVGLAVGAPAVSAVVARPLGGRWADGRGPALVLAGGALLMTVATLPLLGPASLGGLLSTRLAVGAGEGLMMSAAVLWLLRLAGEGRRGRALGHIGLANYGGLTLGPLVADALGGAAHPGRVFAAAALLPLGAAVAVLLIRHPGPQRGERRPLATVVRITARPGVGLMLVNFGYVALLSFGTRVVAGHGASAAQLVVPAFAGTVILVRTAGAGIPDRFGAPATLAVSASGAAAGLAGVAAMHQTGGILVAVIALAAGQALAVPALGLLALAGVSARDHGAAAGAVFAWFDTGVGLGGLGAGALARVAGPADAMLAASTAVALVPLVCARRRVATPA